jgi:hypothetical protein
MEVKYFWVVYSCDNYLLTCSMRLSTKCNNPSNEEVLSGEFETWNLKFLTEKHLWSWKITAEANEEFFLYPVKGKHSRKLTTDREGNYVECSAVNIFRMFRPIQHIKYNVEKLIIIIIYILWDFLFKETWESEEPSLNCHNGRGLIIAIPMKTWTHLNSHTNKLDKKINKTTKKMTPSGMKSDG